MGYIGVMTHLPLWLFRPTACEVWKGGRDWHPLTGGGCRLWPRAPGGGSWGKLGVPGAVFGWTPLKTNELDTQNWWFGKIYLLLAIWPFWAYMLKFLGCITFLFFGVEGCIRQCTCWYKSPIYYQLDSQIWDSVESGNYLEDHPS